MLNIGIIICQSHIHNFQPHGTLIHLNSVYLRIKSSVLLLYLLKALQHMAALLLNGSGSQLTALMCAPPTPTHRQDFVLCGIIVSPLCMSFVWYYLCHLTALLFNGSSHQLAPLMCARRPHKVFWTSLYTKSDPSTPTHRQDFVLCGIFVCLFHTSSASYYHQASVLKLILEQKCTQKWAAQTSDDVNFENPAWDKQTYPNLIKDLFSLVTECIYSAYIEQ